MSVRDESEVHMSSNESEPAVRSKHLNRSRDHHSLFPCLTFSSAYFRYWRPWIPPLPRLSDWGSTQLVELSLSSSNRRRRPLHFQGLPPASLYFLLSRARTRTLEASRSLVLSTSEGKRRASEYQSSRGLRGLPSTFRAVSLVGCGWFLEDRDQRRLVVCEGQRDARRSP